MAEVSNAALASALIAGGGTMFASSLTPGFTNSGYWIVVVSSAAVVAMTGRASTSSTVANADEVGSVDESR